MNFSYEENPEFTFPDSGIYIVELSTINDLYFPIGYFDFVKDYQFYIFNRVGDLIFETNDPSQGWDGKNLKTNKLVPSEIYNCTVSYKDTRGKVYKKNKVIDVIK